MVAQQFYGWYDDADQPRERPSYDPPHNGPCLLCGLAIEPETDVRTISIMPVEGYALRSYFYRLHRTCAEAVPHGDTGALDDFIFNMIERNGD